MGIALFLLEDWLGLLLFDWLVSRVAAHRYLNNINNQREFFQLITGNWDWKLYFLRKRTHLTYLIVCFENYLNPQQTTYRSLTTIK